MATLREAELGRWREYLSLLARLQVEPELRTRIDLSGVVQQTLLDVWQARDRFPRDADERGAWLRTVLANNLTDELRKLRSDKRDITRERSLEAALEASSGRVAALLEDGHSTPSSHAIRAEQAFELARALSRLPPDQRTAVELHHLQGASLEEVGRLMGRKLEATAGLIFRGLRTLRRTMGPALKPE
ncbi:MAG: sigma-70 family RNA polymerase sigma factor [Planctomycetes bacterium]|nr:sigma-70 family RNA polymerase sigma factor [Planctomycetota bacterium]